MITISISHILCVVYIYVYVYLYIYMFIHIESLVRPTSRPLTSDPFKRPLKGTRDFTEGPRVAPREQAEVGAASEPGPPAAEAARVATAPGWRFELEYSII